jgi:antitoxin ParD1/3/4
VIRQIKHLLWGGKSGNMASEANLGGAVAEIHKISIALTADEIAALRAAVESGDYATPGEIVREAIRDWQRKRERRQQEIFRLRELWDQGKASGEAAPLDFDELTVEARRRLAKAASTKGDDG